MIILDNSAAMEIAANTLIGSALESFILSNEQIISCELMRAEAASAARAAKRREGLDYKQAYRRMTLAINLVDDFVAIEELQDEAFRESVRLDHSVYDMFYFVLARRTGATLLSTDRKLIRLCEENGVDCVHEIAI